MKNGSVKRLRTMIVIAMVCLMGVGTLHAQSYPTKPIELVIPFGTGGLTDLTWRSISEIFGKNLNATIVLLNKPGAGGVVGTAYGANAAPDGYTVMSANSDPFTISPIFTPNVPYHPDKDFTYIAKLAAFAQTVSVKADSPFKTLEELLAFAKANPRKLKAAVMGVGSTPHTVLGVLNHEAGIEISFVPFDSGGETVVNLVGGHTDLAVVSATAMKSQVDAGKARILAVCSPKRLPLFPDIPTMSEKGLKKSSIATGLGLAGPKGMDPKIVKTLENAVEKTLQDPKVVDIIGKLGGAVIDFKSGEGYKEELLADYEMFKELLPTLSGKK